MKVAMAMMVLLMLIKWIETKHFLIETESSMRSGGPANDAGTDYSEGIIDIIFDITHCPSVLVAWYTALPMGAAVTP